MAHKTPLSWKFINKREEKRYEKTYTFFGFLFGNLSFDMYTAIGVSGGR